MTFFPVALLIICCRLEVLNYCELLIHINLRVNALHLLICNAISFDGQAADVLHIHHLGDIVLSKSRLFRVLECAQAV